MYAADIFISRLFIHHQSPRDCCRLAWATPWKHCTRQRSGRQLLRIQQVIHSQLTSKPTVETLHIAFYYVLLLELEKLFNINSLGMSIQTTHTRQAHTATPWYIYCHQQQHFKYLHIWCMFASFQHFCHYQNNWRAPWKNRISSTTMKLRKSLVKPVTRQYI